MRVFRREVVEGEQQIAILSQAIGGLVLGKEAVKGLLGIVAPFTIQISYRSVLALGWTDFESLFRTLSVLWSQQRWWRMTPNGFSTFILEHFPIIRNQPTPPPGHPIRGYPMGGREGVWAGADFVWSKNALACR